MAAVAEGVEITTAVPAAVKFVVTLPPRDARGFYRSRDLPSSRFEMALESPPLRWAFAPHKFAPFRIMSHVISSSCRCRKCARDAAPVEASITRALSFDRLSTADRDLAAVRLTTENQRLQVCGASLWGTHAPQDFD